MEALVDTSPNNHVNSKQIQAALHAVFAARAETLRKRLRNLD